MYKSRPETTSNVTTEVDEGIGEGQSRFGTEQAELRRIEGASGSHDTP